MKTEKPPEAHFCRCVKRGLVKTPQGKPLVFHTLPPPDPEHPQHVYDTFFSCMAFHVAHNVKYRKDVRDRLLCHLGAIVFDHRYVRGYDVVDTALNTDEGEKILERRLRNPKEAQSIVDHYAMRILISKCGAYVGCTEDALGGSRLGRDPDNWIRQPDAFARAVGRFVEDNLGDIPSAPRRGVAHHLKTQTTCVDVFLYLALDLYPDWRPIVYKSQYVADEQQYVVSPVEYRPDFSHIRGDAVALYQEWCNNAQPIYMFYDGRTKRYHLLRTMRATAPGVLFALRCRSDKRDNVLEVGTFSPPTSDALVGVARDAIHTLALQGFQIHSKRFYSINPANKNDDAFQIPANQRLFVYTVRPAQVVQQEWHMERLNTLWQAPGSTHSQLAIPLEDAVDAPASTASMPIPQWPPETTHVIEYKSHEARTGVAPIFTLTKDVQELLVVVARDQQEAVAALRRHRPRQPLVSMECNGVVPLEEN